MDHPDQADRLYILPPREFVAARDAAVAAARESGDAGTAAVLAKLRRPTVGAWLVNLLALRRPELVSGLAELAAALQSAQRELDGEQLRELGNQRRATVSALVATSRSLAEEAEPELAGAKLPLAEVETTLNAALADREVAETVRAGRLTRAVTYEGFGEPPRARLRLVHGGAGRPAAPATGTGEPAEPDRQAVAAELTAARAAAEAASRELDVAAADQEAAKQELAGIDAQLAELATRRAAAADRLAAAERASHDARRAVVAARRRLGEAEAAAEAG